MKRPRHLMDPNNLPRPRNVQREQQSLVRVQRWVISTLAVTTILHLCVGLVLAAIFLPRPLLSAEIGLNVIASALGVVAVGIGLAIHRHSLASAWLALGLLPGVVGLWLTLVVGR